MAKYLILFLMCLNGWGQGDLDKSINQQAYQIKYSSDWKLDETGRHGSEFFLFHTPVSVKFGNNINLMIQNIESLNLNLHFLMR